MKITLTTLLILACAGFSFGQENEKKSDWSFMVGYRSMPIPVCNCFFLPTEFEIKNRTGVLFGGGTFVSKLGFMVSSEVGYFRRTAIDSRVGGDASTVLSYVQGATNFKGYYYNGTVGYIFGRHRLRFGIISGVDFHLESTIQRTSYISQFLNIGSVTQTFPTAQPFRTGIDTTYNSMTTHSKAFLLGFRISFDLTKHFQVIGGSELQWWPNERYDTQYPLKQHVGSYRLALGYKF